MFVCVSHLVSSNVCYYYLYLCIARETLCTGDYPDPDLVCSDSVKPYEGPIFVHNEACKFATNSFDVTP